MSDNYTSQPVQTVKLEKTPHQITETCLLYLINDLRRYVASIPEWERQDFFDPRNADGWKQGFAQWLMRPREFASND